MWRNDISYSTDSVGTVCDCSVSVTSRLISFMHSRASLDLGFGIGVTGLVYTVTWGLTSCPKAFVDIWETRLLGHK